MACSSGSTKLAQSRSWTSERCNGKGKEKEEMKEENEYTIMTMMSCTMY